MSPRAWFAVVVALILAPCVALAQPIDRHALVSRHNPSLSAIDPHAPLMVGNGQIWPSRPTSPACRPFPSSIPTSRRC
jgi:hypothetical protein